jgi:hypothetical protein
VRTASIIRDETIILHGSTTQKTALNILLAAVRTWILTLGILLLVLNVVLLLISSFMILCFTVSLFSYSNLFLATYHFKPSVFLSDKGKTLCETIWFRSRLYNRYREKNCSYRLLFCLCTILPVIKWTGQPACKTTRKLTHSSLFKRRYFKPACGDKGYSK